MSDVTDNENAQPTADDAEIASQDLDLVDDSLEDEGKDDVQLWDEIEQAEAAAENGDDPDDAGAEPETAASDDLDETETTAQNDDAGGEAPSGEVETPPDDDTAAAAAAASGGDDDGSPDIWSSATPEQKEAFEQAQKHLKKLEQSDRSSRGRLSSMQRQINELLANGRGDNGSTAAADDDAAGDGKVNKPGQFLKTDSWKSFAEEYPEVANPIQEVISGLQSTIESQGEALNAIGTERHQDDLDEQTALLEEEHEDWEEVTAADEFVPWLEAQPRHIREAALRNAEEIVDAEEAADVVGRFKAFRSAQEEVTGDTANDNGSETPTPEGDGNGKPTELSERRKRQIETAATAKTNGPGAGHGVPEDGDEEAIWNAFDKQEAREARRA